MERKLRPDEKAAKRLRKLAVIELIQKHPNHEWGKFKKKYIGCTHYNLEFERTFKGGVYWSNILDVDAFIEMHKLVKDKDGNFVLPTGNEHSQRVSK